ncbi:MAG: hypothetical protein ACRDHW_15485 [Ktedonobacteraceae bacterium]
MAFERIQPEFEACFRFTQEVHGQKRLAAFSVAEVVYYLHALWLCECKDRLLSAYKNIRRYEGRRCLELLRSWQAGRNAEVVAFLTNKLDMLSFNDITARLEEARNQQGESALADRLQHGRLVLLNRGMNLLHALEALFSPSEEALLQEVRAACRQYNHSPAQIKAQLAELETPLYTYRPHQLLAQQNMVAMNRLDVDVLAQPTDIPGTRTWYTASSTEPLAPFAEQVISGYLALHAPLYNNRRGVRFVDRVELERNASV